VPYNIKQIDDKFVVVATNTGKVVGTHPSKKKAQAQLSALYANVEDVKKERGTIAGESSANSGRISGGVGWKIEFNTPDCQHGWSVIKVGSGQSIGCFFKEEDAKAALEALAVTEPIVKAEGGYKPTSGMKSAAAKAIKWKEEGKAKGAGTNVGWTRAHQIVSGESLSLDTVKRMYSFFSRHEVDKQGKEWDKPSHGKVMWYAWGGDAGYSWSRAIVERENKVEKKIWAGAFSPTYLEKNYSRKCMTCGCDDLGNDHHYISDTQKCMYCMSKGQGPCWDGYQYAGTKEQDGKTVPNCIPNKVKKDDASGQTNQNKQEGIGSFSFWNGAFGPVPGLQNGDAGWKSTYNTPPQKDGTPTVGYGNHSDPKGRSNQ
jgi:hypothetical protein